MRQKTKWKTNNGNSGKKDIDPKIPNVPCEPGKCVKRQENSVRKQHRSRSIDRNVPENHGRDGKEVTETSETKEDLKKRKLMEMCESKPSLLSDDAMYLRKEII